MLDVNPMHWLIDSWRQVMIFESWPDWALLGRFAVVAFLILWLGATFFNSQSKRFPDLL